MNKCCKCGCMSFGYHQLIGDDYWCNRCLPEYVADLKASVARCMDEKCDMSERHCTCVPTLRQEVKRLTEKLAAAETMSETRREMLVDLFNNVTALCAMRDKLKQQLAEAEAQVHTCPECGEHCVNCDCMRHRLSVLEITINGLERNRDAWHDQCVRLTEVLLRRVKMLKWFEFEHLPGHLQVVSQEFHRLALWITNNIANGPERTVALRKLLEAKDAAVRAKIGD